MTTTTQHPGPGGTLIEKNTTHVIGNNAIPVHGFVINPTHVITRKLNGTTISTT